MIDLQDGSLEEIGDEFEIFTKEELVGVVTHGRTLNVDAPANAGDLQQRVGRHDF